MNILFLGYWNVDDPLTSATILPHLRILRTFSKIDKIVFANAQREPVSQSRREEIEALGVDYRPLHSKNLQFNLINKVYDFILFPKLLLQLIEQNDIRFIIARGAPAGGLAYLTQRKSRVPFVVESFEPHADYMLTTNTWKRYDLRYLYQVYLEKQQKKYALSLITVSSNYKSGLEMEGIDRRKISVAPCAVNPSKFYIDDSLRKEARLELNIPVDAMVGIYAGKFGGLYYEDEAFELFYEAFAHYQDFYLLLLSSHDKKWIQKKIRLFNLPEGRTIHLFVAHNYVNKFLNAADFAFALYKRTSVAQYLSPVKIGEYWATGLPLILTEGVGDENEIIKDIGGGVLFDPHKTENIFFQLDQIKSSYTKEFYNKLSKEYRSTKQIQSIYEKLFNPEI